MMINRKPRLKMKRTVIFAALFVLSLLLSTLFGNAATILVTNPGNWNWSSTVANQPWPGGTLPKSNDFVEVYDNIIITNDMTNATCQALDSSQGAYQNGEVVMAPGSTLYVSGQNEGFGTAFLGALNATATNSTVVYQGNAFWAMKTNYWNLVFSGWGDFYNGL